MYGEEESLSGQRFSKDHSWRIAKISWVLGPVFQSGVLDNLVQMQGIVDSFKYQQIKNLNLAASFKKRIMGRG